MQSRKILVNIGLTAFATLLAGFIVFIFGEAYFRLTIQADRPGPSHEFKVYHPTRGWALRPGAYSYFDFRAFRDVKIRINEFGLRNQQISLSLPANKQRVTVLGDSFVFAAALNDGEHLTDQLQELAENRWEVVNASVEGYGTGQQILLLKELLEHGYTMGNHIILAFFTNDILDNVGLGYEGKPSPSKPIFSVDQHGELQHSKPENVSQQKSTQHFLSNWFFYSFLRSRIEVILATHPNLLNFLGTFGITPDLPRVPGIISGWYNQGWEERWRSTKNLLQYLVKFTKIENDTPLSILFIPSPFQASDVHRAILSNQKEKDPRYQIFLTDQNRPQNLLREFCESGNIPFIDASPTLRRKGQDVPMFFPREGHLNEQGSQVVAELVNHLIENEIKASLRLKRP